MVEVYSVIVLVREVLLSSLIRKAMSSTQTSILGGDAVGCGASGSGLGWEGVCVGVGGEGGEVGPARLWWVGNLLARVLGWMDLVGLCL